MYIYAQLSDNNICTSIIQTHGEIESPNVIPVPTFDISYVGKKYENGEWVNNEEVTPVQKPLTDEQRAIYDTQSNVEYLVCLAELGM